MKVSLIALVAILSFSTQSRAETSSIEAKEEIAAVKKFSGSKLEKRLVLQSCKKIESLAALCSGISARDISEAQLQEIKASVLAVLEAKAAESSEASESEEQIAQESSADSQQLASGAVNINTTGGTGNVQTNNIGVNQAANDCIRRATANISRITASLNARGIGKNKVKAQ